MNNEQADEELRLRLAELFAQYANDSQGDPYYSNDDIRDDTERKQRIMGDFMPSDEVLNNAMSLVAQHTKAAERLARIEELEEVKKYFPEYASASTAKLLLCVNNRIVVLEAELAAAQRKDGDAVQN